MNIIDKIKIGDILYSTVAGTVIVTNLESTSEDYPIETVIKRDDEEICGRPLHFSKEGKYLNAGECVLFPSKENRDWSTYNSNKFNINTLEPFDKVLVRDWNRNWVAGFYSHYENYNGHCFIVNGNAWEQCIPYNDDTKHLVGTTDMPNSKYINW